MTCISGMGRLTRLIRSSARGRRPLTLMIACFALVGTVGHGDESRTDAGTREAPQLFDGKTLNGWRIIDNFDFVDHGKVEVTDGIIHLNQGKPATGISWKGKLPRINYELSFAAKRVEGRDFFCGLTFPVKSEYCTLILGGWGGSVVGLSNINGFSAIENDTTQAVEFVNGRWYRVKLTVTDDRIKVRLDDEDLIDTKVKGRRFSIWWEQEPVTPLGIVTWKTSGAFKDIKLKHTGS